MSQDRDYIEAENIAACIAHIEENRHLLKRIDPEELDRPSATQPQGDKTVETISRAEMVSRKYQTPAQETDEEYTYRSRQIEYERGNSFLKNKALADSINALTRQNFTNRALAAACDFTEMADHYPRSVFINKFGPLIQEELKADPTKPSKRLASFTTAYFWKEANWSRIVAVVKPETTRDELLEFLTLPLNSEPDRKIADCLPVRVINQIILSSDTKEREGLKSDSWEKRPYISLEESDKLEKSVVELSKQNFTNRLLTSTAYFADIANPFNTIRSMSQYFPIAHKELQENPNKPSPTLVTMMTERCFRDKDVKFFIDSVTPGTTKGELSEFLTAREKWSTGLRMIDYLNHYVVTGMARFLPDEDKLDLWSLKPEMVRDFHVGESIRKLSDVNQKKIISEIKDPILKKRIQDDIDNPLVGGIHVSVGLMGGGYVNPNTLDISAKFATIRERRICSHEDNRHFFPTQEHFRSSF